MNECRGTCGGRLGHGWRVSQERIGGTKAPPGRAALWGIGVAGLRRRERGQACSKIVWVRMTMPPWAIRW